MNPKPLIFAAFLACSASLGHATRAQSISDPGISTHNYKHPHKAAAAPKARLVVESSDPALAARFAAFNVGRPVSDATPKYATREVRFVVFTRQRKQRNVINPLVSTHNYKTGNGVHAIKPIQEPEWICGTI
ncbi:MAG: hypothetical protein J7619_08810 [Dyadobacter sp.]|uniref:hypothetical protein n=1 Tax=Dyadobacter sp. TaxID=1914288 RepID=UPI001B17CEC1|nr:hypothetical protein [Dyadobacter sp.]MBO9612780.1 hypothetical protein [Dyadobacter sp.]